MKSRETSWRTNLLYQSTMFLVFLATGGGRLVAQHWHPTPDRLTLECHMLAAPDDSTVVCANKQGLLRIDFSRNPRLGSYIYLADGSIKGLWADDSVILVVDGYDGFNGNLLRRSTDHGRTWDQVDVSEFGVQPYTIRSDESGRLFLGCTFATILVSEDKGRTWSLLERFSQLSTDQHMVPNSIDYHPDGAVVSIVDIAMKDARGANRWYRQQQSGSWTDISFAENLDRMDEWEIVRLDETRLAGLETDRVGWLRLHFSTDNGDTWSLAEGIDPVHLPPLTGPLLCVDRENGWLYVSLSDGSNRNYGPIHITRDFGNTFENIGGELRVYGLAKGYDGRVWALFTDWGKHSLWRENDDRTRLELVLDGSSLGVSYPMTELPVTSLTGSLDPRGGVWFALVMGDGVWRTMNTGRSWSRLAKSSWDEATCLASGRDGAVYIGSDLGVARMERYSDESWEPLTHDVGVRKIEVVSDNGVIAETTGGSVVRIESDGTVKPIDPENSFGPTRLLNVDRYDRVTVADSFGIYMLPNFSSRWVRVGDSNLSRRALSFCAIDENHLLVGTDSGLFISTNAGRTWSPTGMYNQRVDRLLTTDAKMVHYPISVVVPRVVARTGDTLWSSVDTGATWLDIAETLPDGAVTAVTADNNGSLVAAIYGYGVYWQNYPVILSVEPVRVQTPEITVKTGADGVVQILIPLVGPVSPDVSLTMVDLLGREVEGEAFVRTDQINMASVVWTPHGGTPRVLLGMITIDDSIFQFKSVRQK